MTEILQNVQVFARRQRRRRRRQSYDNTSSFSSKTAELKIGNFHVFDIDWLCRTSRYAIVKVDVTERNDVTKRHGIVITVWRTSATEVTAL